MFIWMFSALISPLYLKNYTLCPLSHYFFYKLRGRISPVVPFVFITHVIRSFTKSKSMANGVNYQIACFMGQIDFSEVLLSTRSMDFIE